MPVRVLVLGNDALARAGLVALLGRESALAVAGQARLAELNVALAAGHADALAIDGGQGDLHELRDLDNAPPAVVLTTQAQAAEALSLGARGLLTRAADGAQLSAALVAAAAGLITLDPALAPALLRQRAPAGPPGEALTKREAEVLQQLSLGFSNKLIAARLNISEHTAKFHVNSILAKLGAGSRAEAIVRAARSGLVSL